MTLISWMIVELRDNMNNCGRNELRIDKPDNAFARASYNYNILLECQVERMPGM
jgi:hypothetical protein